MHSRQQLRFRTIDANITAGGNQKFHFIGDDAFSRTAGEPHFREIGAITKGGVDGDGRTDFTIDVVGASTLTAGDFLS